MIYSTLNEAWSKNLRVGKIPTDYSEPQQPKIDPSIVLTDPDLIHYFRHLHQDPNDIIRSLIFNTKRGIEKQETPEESDDDDRVLFLVLLMMLILFY